MGRWGVVSLGVSRNFVTATLIHSGAPETFQLTWRRDALKDPELMRLLRELSEYIVGQAPDFPAEKTGMGDV